MSAFELIDTHCHIHDSEFLQKYEQSADSLIVDAQKAGISTLMCVGTDVRSSIEAVCFVQGRKHCYASVALHPHEAANKPTKQLNLELATLEKLLQENNHSQVVAIGECGLDYYYHKSGAVKQRQQQLLKAHIMLALRYDLPVIFHIRNSKNDDESIVGSAFRDLFEILDLSNGRVRGVIHSYSAGPKELEGVLARGLSVGLNGIMTFTKQRSQLKAAKMVPLERLVLETDAPFLTPEPFRGRMCTPKHLLETAKFLSKLRGESLGQLAQATTQNSKKLFGI